MKGAIKIILVGLVVVVVNVAIIWILKVVDLISSTDFTNLIKDSLSIIGIIVLAGVIISALLSFKK